MPDDTQAPDPSQVMAGMPAQMPNVGQSTPQMPTLAPQSPGMQQATSAPSPRPILLDLIKGLIHPQAQNLAANRPTSRTDVLEGFLGNFMQALGAGFANEGRGPGAALRGAGAAMGAPYQQQLQAQAQQVENQQKQAQTQLTSAQAQPVNIPGYGNIPAGSIGPYFGMQGRLGAAQIGADAKRDVAEGQNATKMGVEQFKANLQIGKISHIEDYRDPQTGQLGKMGYNMMGEPIGLLSGSLPTSSLFPKSTTSQQWIETSPGKWDKVDKTSTSQTNIPGGSKTTPTPATGPASGFPKTQSAPSTATKPQGTGSSRTIYGGGPIYAFDPKTSETTLTTAQDAQQNGYTNPRKVTAKEIDEDRQLNNRLADVATKLTRYEGEVTKPLSMTDATVLSGMLSSDKFKLGAFGMEIPVDFVNKFIGAARDRNLSPDGIKRVVSYFNARESMVGYQRVLSGGSKSNEKAMELNLDALPNPLTSPQYAREGLKQFKENLTIAGQGLPRMPGIMRAKDILNPPPNIPSDLSRILGNMR